MPHIALKHRDWQAAVCRQRAQPIIESARAFGERHWLYVVEQARTQQARIVRFQDPAGEARTFTFDQR